LKLTGESGIKAIIFILLNIILGESDIDYHCKANRGYYFKLNNAILEFKHKLVVAIVFLCTFLRFTSLVNDNNNRDSSFVMIGKTAVKHPVWSGKGLTKILTQKTKMAVEESAHLTFCFFKSFPGFLHFISSCESEFDDLHFHLFIASVEEGSNCFESLRGGPDF